MEAFILLGGFAAMVVFGYCIMSRLDNFLKAVQQENERRDEASCLHIATSSLDAVPEILRILKDMSGRYPDARCSISFGQESEVIQAVDTGAADAAILPADAASGIQAQWKCFALNRQPFSIGGGTVEIRSLQGSPRFQKILWKNTDPHALVSEFIQQLCGQQPWSVV